MGGFECPKCHTDKVSYDFVTHTFECKCGYKEVVEPTIGICPRCGHRYEYFTWFDPSGCICGFSFIE